MQLAGAETAASRGGPPSLRHLPCGTKGAKEELTPVAESTLVIKTTNQAKKKKVSISETHKVISVSSSKNTREGEPAFPPVPSLGTHVGAVRKPARLPGRPDRARRPVAAAAPSERPWPAQRRPRGRGNPPGSLPGRALGEVPVVTAAEFPHVLRGKHRPPQRAARMGAGRPAETLKATSAFRPHRRAGRPPPPEDTAGSSRWRAGPRGSRCVTGHQGARARTSPRVGTGPRGGRWVTGCGGRAQCGVRVRGEARGPEGASGTPVRVHPCASWRRARGAGGPCGGGDPQGPEVFLSRGGCPVSLGTVCPRTS